VDIEYLKDQGGKENPFDLLSNAGFAPLVWHLGTSIWECVKITPILIYIWLML
jgi:hypothetical protein